MPYTYIVQCQDGSFYTGWTINLEKRIKTHNEGKGGHYTRAKRPVKLVYWEEWESREEAQRRENAIKKMSRKEKESLIQAL